MALKKLKMNQKKNFNVCLERVVPVSKNSIIYKQSIVLLVWISDWPALILFPPYRRRELQQLVEPEASPSTRMRQACLNMADSSRSFYKSYHEFHWTIPPPPFLLCLSQGKMAERWRSAAGFWCPSCTTPRRTVSSWVSCAVFTWLPWMPMATLTHMSKCK